MRVGYKEHGFSGYAKKLNKPRRAITSYFHDMHFAQLALNHFSFTTFNSNQPISSIHLFLFLFLYFFIFFFFFFSLFFPFFFETFAHLTTFTMILNLNYTTHEPQ